MFHKLFVNSLIGLMACTAGPPFVHVDSYGTDAGASELTANYDAAVPRDATHQRVHWALGVPPHAPFSASLGPKGPVQCANGTSSHQCTDDAGCSMLYGLDYALPIGTDVLAVADGTVVFIHDGEPNNTGNCFANKTEICGKFHGLGNVVVVEHGPQDYSAYFHLNAYSIVVSLNQAVKAGAILGQVGWSGFGSGAHLHFQMQSTDGGDKPLKTGYQSKPFDGWHSPTGTPQLPCTKLTSYNIARLTANKQYSGSVAKDGTYLYVFEKTQDKSYVVTVASTNGGDPDVYASTDSAVSKTNNQYASILGAGSNDTVSFTATSSGPFFVLVFGYSNATYSIKVTESGATAGAPAQPASGACETPIALNNSGGTVTGLTAGASALASSCGQSATAPEKIYQFTAPYSGMVTVSATTSSFDAVLNVRADSCSGAELACKDVIGQSGTETVSFNASAGVTYTIVVDGYQGQAGAYTLTMTLAPATNSANASAGSCSNPIPLIVGGASVQGATSGTSALASSCGQSATAPERIYQLTAPTSGVVTVAATTTAFDAVLVARVASCGGTELACKDAMGQSGTESLTFSATAGATYVVVVDGFQGQAGSYSLLATIQPAQTIGCPNGCSGNGVCNSSNGTCSCNSGWTGSSCATPQTYACPNACSGNGICNTSNGTCSCNSGWTGSSCATPQTYACPNACSGNGNCNSSNGMCTCNSGWTGSSCATPQSYPCPNGCSGNGTCNTSNGSCTCNSGWTGNSCATPQSFPCPNACSGNGNCNTSSGTCTCNAGWSGSSCATPQTYPCPNACSGNGGCNTSSGTCACNLGWTGSNCATPTINWNCANSEFSGSQFWTCSGSDRFKCVAGTPTKQPCGQSGCFKRENGKDDLCIVADPNWVCSHSMANGAQWWTCKTDGKLHKCDATGAGKAVACPAGCAVKAIATNDTCN